MTRDEIITLCHQLDCLDSQHYGSLWVDNLVALCKAVESRAREACAKQCDEIAEDRWGLYKGRGKYSGREDGRAHPQTQGESIGAEMCAEAIRGMK